jgi:hypothetical protein
MMRDSGLATCIAAKPSSRPTGAIFFGKASIQ